MSELYTQYNKEIAPRLKKELKLTNVNQIPKLKRICVNVGIGTYLKNATDPEPVVDNIAKITGQKPLLIKSKKAVSNFKLRVGQPNGVYVTLRNQKMYDFLYKLINVVLPRVKDFRGISEKSFDGNGNYSFGITEHTIFPEIMLDDVIRTHGIQITIVTSTPSDEHAKALLKAFHFPFKKSTKKE